MEIVSKILFFSFVIVLGFIPGGIFISFFLLVLYYLPHILKSNESEVVVNSELEDRLRKTEFRIMNSYSDGTLEDMK